MPSCLPFTSWRDVVFYRRKQHRSHKNCNHDEACYKGRYSEVFSQPHLQPEEYERKAHALAKPWEEPQQVLTHGEDLRDGKGSKCRRSEGHVGVRYLLYLRKHCIYFEEEVSEE
eukprot:CAMPEP_0197622516 /NCGR_PEP_ID=MMETSP1338-20131121/2793_1 /TAXON_ID=43686 ORGANISM="Pelagodinium beii, Strain RCC1491" /NCGR_SAMPLE_ID=MMETSP1338 /ASSEMBLY_ACC=CAM_ASM_000754 /LENGTH=113 /DNA_ID=CAMNT_0043192255 /DNA_START=49 /DNA_END=390 /DNA_ORIENTATION=+